MSLKSANLFDHLPEQQCDEEFLSLIQNDTFKLERIVSKGHITEEGKWYDQDQYEWVLLLKGKAKIRFEHEVDTRTLNPGDHIIIPAHCRHRVEWTDETTETIWLALHYDAHV